MTARYKPTHQAGSDQPVAPADGPHPAVPDDIQNQRSAAGFHSLEELFRSIFDDNASDPKQRR
jgi:hypothetical protein